MSPAVTPTLTPSTASAEFFSKQNLLWRHLAEGKTEAQVRAGKVERVCSQARGRALTPAWGSETSTFAQRSPTLLIPSVPARHHHCVSPSLHLSVPFPTVTCVSSPPRIQVLLSLAMLRNQLHCPHHQPQPPAAA